jgi:TonB family protein
MKSLIFLTLLATLPLCAGAQSQPKIIAYLNEYCHPVPDTSQAVYYRTVERVKGKYLVRDYYMSGQLQTERLCDAIAPNLKWDGTAVLYYENGAKQEEGPFKDEERYGMHRYWYDNGKMQKVVFHKDKNTAIYHYFWSPDGIAMLDRGNGLIQEVNEISPWKTEIKDSVAIASFWVDPVFRDTIYGMTERGAMYKGGLTALAMDMKATLKYPKSARRAGVEGPVYVSFVIDKNGNMRALRVIKGIGSGCDEEALRAVSTLKQWIPASHHDKRVSSAFVLPVRFDLKGWSFF